MKKIGDKYSVTNSKVRPKHPEKDLLDSLWQKQRKQFEARMYAYISSGIGTDTGNVDKEIDTTPREVIPDMKSANLDAKPSPLKLDTSDCGSLVSSFET
mgnify:CR=1 FL=1